MQVLHFYSFDRISKWTYWGFEVCFLAGFFLLAWLCIGLRKSSSI